MRKRYIILFIICIVLLLKYSAFAQRTADITGRLGIGLEGGGVFPQDTEFSYFDIDLHNGYTYGGSITLGITRFFALEFKINRYEEIEAENITEDIESGEATVTPLTLTGQFRYVGQLPGEYQNWAVYLGGGVGYYFIDFDESRELKVVAANRGYTTKVDIDDAFGFHIEGGAEAFLTKNFAIYLAVRHFWVNTDVEQKWIPQGGGQPTVEKDECDFDATLVVGGFKFFFY